MMKLKHILNLGLVLCICVIQLQAEVTYNDSGNTAIDMIKVNDEKAFKKAVQLIKEELKLKFVDSGDPGLHERRVRLRALFESIPHTFAERFYNQLGLERRDDALSKLFHFKLHTATRMELLEILNKKISEQPETDEAPVLPDIAILLIKNKPLPPGMEDRFHVALDALESLVVGHPSEKRYLCWIKRLRKPNADDRVIKWSTICHRETQAALPMSPGCEMRSASSIASETDMARLIKTKDDVVPASEELPLFTHLKTHILYAHERSKLELMTLELLEKDVRKNLKVLEFMTTKPMGGGSAAPFYYVAIKAWLKDRQSDSTSIYSCF